MNDLEKELQALNHICDKSSDINLEMHREIVAEGLTLKDKIIARIKELRKELSNELYDYEKTFGVNAPETNAIRGKWVVIDDLLIEIVGEEN